MDQNIDRPTDGQTNRKTDQTTDGLRDRRAKRQTGQNEEKKCI